MREIQDLTLHRAITRSQRLARLDTSADEFRARVENMHNGGFAKAIGIRVTAMPMTARLQMMSATQLHEDLPLSREMRLNIGPDRHIGLQVPGYAGQRRQALRSIIRATSDTDEVHYSRLGFDGLVEY